MEPLEKGRLTEAEEMVPLVRAMKQRGWLVKKVTGSAYMEGWPDYFAAHKDHGTRWFEAKRPKDGKLSRVQVVVFGQFQRAGVDIYILETERDYQLLFGKANWWKYCLEGRLR